MLAQVREEKSSKSSSESFFFDAQGRRFKELHGECMGEQRASVAFQIARSAFAVSKHNICDLISFATDIHPPVGLDFGGNWLPVINANDCSESEGWSPCRCPSLANASLLVHIEPLTFYQWRVQPVLGATLEARCQTVSPPADCFYSLPTPVTVAPQKREQPAKPARFDAAISRRRKWKYNWRRR